MYFCSSDIWVVIFVYDTGQLSLWGYNMKTIVWIKVWPFYWSTADAWIFLGEGQAPYSLWDIVGFFSPLSQWPTSRLFTPKTMAMVFFFVTMHNTWVSLRMAVWRPPVPRQRPASLLSGYVAASARSSSAEPWCHSGRFQWDCSGFPVNERWKLLGMKVHTDPLPKEPLK